MTDKIPSPSSSEDKIDLKDLVIPIWNARKQIFLTTILFTLLGAIIGFLTPPTYTASSTFLPQNAQSGTGGGSLGGLAALAGINLGSPFEGGDIPPSMFPKLLASEPFRQKIIDSKIFIGKDSIYYKDYLKNQPIPILELIKGYTLGLPGKLVGFLSFSKEQNFQVANQAETNKFSYVDYGLINSILGKINISYNQKEGLISIDVVEGDPIVAAEVAMVTEQVLKGWISDYKIKNAKSQYDYIEKQFQIKESEFFAIQGKLASFKDRNQNIFSASNLTNLDRLQSEFDLASSIYSELAKQKAQAAISLNKETPTFMTLDPVKIPQGKTAPRISQYLIGGAFLGLLFSCSWILMHKPISRLLIFFRSNN
jgi:hypothetical protein